MLFRSVCLSFSRIRPQRYISPSELLCHCITPDGAFWHTGRNRLLVDREKLVLQGVFPDYGLTESFSSAFEGDLAGNAFNSVDFVVAFLALMSAIAESSNFSEVVGAPPKDEEIIVVAKLVGEMKAEKEVELEIPSFVETPRKSEGDEMVVTVKATEEAPKKRKLKQKKDE